MERRPKVKRNNNNNKKRTHKLKSKDHVVQLGFFFVCVVRQSSVLDCRHAVRG